MYNEATPVIVLLSTETSVIEPGSERWLVYYFIIKLIAQRLCPELNNLFKIRFFLIVLFSIFEIKFNYFKNPPNHQRVN